MDKGWSNRPAARPRRVSSVEVSVFQTMRSLQLLPRDWEANPSEMGSQNLESILELEYKIRRFGRDALTGLGRRPERDAGRSPVGIGA